jgi:glycosyltransferase involved in cell wall biosynthesis
MTLVPRQRLTWLVPDDKGGGVVSVAQGCCRQAALAGRDATLLLALTPSGHAADFGTATLASLEAPLPYSDIPSRLVEWLEANPQDVLVLNGCEEADAAIPYIPSTTRLVYVVHDTAPRYYAAALRHEDALDAIVAVSETVAKRFRHRLRQPDKLAVIHNGTIFPTDVVEAIATPRSDDLVFVGGDNFVKGALDAAALWRPLLAAGFPGRLHWLGHVGEEFRARIEALPQSERITILGRQPRSAVFEIARRARVVLMLSRVEPFGMVTVECMGMGCLVASWDIDTGTKEIVAGEDGMFAPLGDYSALASGIMQLMARQLGRAAATAGRIQSQFGEDAMWVRYAELIGELLRKPAGRRSLAGTQPPTFQPPVRLFQLLPSSLRACVRTVVGNSPRLGYLLRDLRGR